jgi:hypothetical protein
VTVSVGSSFLIALVIVVCLGVCIGIVMWASRRPSFRHHVRPRQTGTGIIGGIHQGDPRSVSPRRDEVVEYTPPDEPSEPDGWSEYVEAVHRRGSNRAPD